MTQPVVRPDYAPGPPRRTRRRWLTAIALAATLGITALGSYEVGQKFAPANIWDPLWLRAYLGRPADQGVPGNGFWVAGYYVDYDAGSLEVVKTRSNHMDQVVVFGYGFDEQGNLQGKEQQIVRGLVGKSKRMILFGNLTDGGFNQETAHAILTNPAVQDRAVRNLIAKAQELEAGGVQIDFENIAGGDRDAYTAFLKRLKAELQPLGMTLSIAAAAKTSDTRTGWGGATDYAAIGQIVDQVYIMAYDEHWRGGEPGPVASLNWVERVVRYATGVIPAQKIVLGVPFYGYEWAVDTREGTANNRAYSFTRLDRRVAELGGAAKWDPVAGENVATYAVDGSQRIAWWPDERSLEAKLKLAYQYNLKGIALWRLGFEDDQWWNRLGAFRLEPMK
ncbi:MAG TPA: glycosyl hydrolase family 18 protein [Symbiobacteriaceae bacterium]|nr:glycosyl hydrolase family 18 protein [Symbiobacteriaceae bacterium]